MIRYVLEAAEIGSEYVSSLRGTEFSIVKAKDPAEKDEKQRLRNLKMRIESAAEARVKCIYYEHCINEARRKLGDTPVQVNTIHTYWRPYLNLLRKMDKMNSPTENKDDDGKNSENS